MDVQASAEAGALVEYEDEKHLWGFPAKMAQTKTANQTKTAKEAQTEYVKHMGTPLGVQFSALWQELAWLYLKWGEYNELFGTRPSRVRLLTGLILVACPTMPIAAEALGA